MEKCKFCQADLAENSSVCPSCGADNAESVKVQPAEEVAAAPAAAQKKYSSSTIALIIAGIVLVIAVFVSAANSGKANLEQTSGNADATAPTVSAEDAVPVGTIPTDGNPDDETCKGSYTAADADVIAAADVVVATAGDGVYDIQVEKDRTDNYYGYLPTTDGFFQIR